MSIAIGMDIGGTKTRCIAIDLSSGKILAKAIEGAANPASTPRNIVIDTIRRCVSACLDSASRKSSDVVVVGIASAGVGKGYWRKIFEEALEVLGIASDKIDVFEDYVAAHVACFLFNSGILYIAGTGSSLYGVCRDRAVKIGGWGHLLDDEGSAYQVGRDGIAVALRSWDGREESTELLNALLKFFNIDNPEMIIPIIYGSQNPKLLIASFAKEVVSLAKKGDRKALEIIEKSVREIFKSLVVAMKRLDCRDIGIAIVGGFYEGARELIEPLLLAMLKSIGYARSIVRQVIDISCAAVLITLKNRKLLNREVMERIMNSCRIAYL